MSDGNDSNRSGDSGKIHPFSGFTFIEVLIAMALLSIALFGMTSWSGWVTGRNLLSRQILTAVGMARDRIEELQSLPVGWISLVPTRESRTDSEKITYQMDTCFREFPDRMEIDVRVSWFAAGKTRGVAMNLIRGRPDS